VAQIKPVSIIKAVKEFSIEDVKANNNGIRNLIIFNNELVGEDDL